MFKNCMCCLCYFDLLQNFHRKGCDRQFINRIVKHWCHPILRCNNHCQYSIIWIVRKLERFLESMSIHAGFCCVPFGQGINSGLRCFKVYLFPNVILENSLYLI